MHTLAPDKSKDDASLQKRDLLHSLPQHLVVHLWPASRAWMARKVCRWIRAKVVPRITAAVFTKQLTACLLGKDSAPWLWSEQQREQHYDKVTSLKRSLAKGLAAFQSLTRINFTDMDRVDLEFFDYLLKGCKLEHLQLKRVDVFAGVFDLAAVATWTSLSSLVLSRSNVGAAQAQVLATALAACTSLTRLELHQTKISTDGGGALAPTLSVLRQLKQLDLSDNHIAPPDMRQIVSAIASATAMQSLHLGGNMMKDRAANRLALVVGTFKHLQHLSLRDGAIGPVASANLIRALASCPGLCHLDLSLNKIHDEGALSVAAAVPDWEALQRLELRKSGIGYAGAQGLVGRLCAAAAATSLRCLDLGENSVSPGESKALWRAALGGCTGLTQLDAGGGWVRGAAPIWEDAEEREEREEREREGRERMELEKMASEWRGRVRDGEEWEKLTGRRKGQVDKLLRQEEEQEKWKQKRKEVEELTSRWRGRAREGEEWEKLSDEQKDQLCEYVSRKEREEEKERRDMERMELKKMASEWRGRVREGEEWEKLTDQDKDALCRRLRREEEKERERERRERERMELEKMASEWRGRVREGEEWEKLSDSQKECLCMQLEREESEERRKRMKREWMEFENLASVWRGRAREGEGWEKLSDQAKQRLVHRFRREEEWRDSWQEEDTGGHSRQTQSGEGAG